MSFIASRYHDISCGHRVHGHESKCRHLHGHNYRITFHCEADVLDTVGRVIDFSDIKSRLCMWLEDNYDHKFLAWEEDPVMRALVPSCQPGSDISEEFLIANESIVWVPFNPTAENIAQYLVEVIGPRQLDGTGIRLVSCEVEETRKCSASFITD